MVDPKADESWKTLKPHIRTDEVHAKDRLNPSIETAGAVFEDISSPDQLNIKLLCGCCITKIKMATVL